MRQRIWDGGFEPCICPVVSCCWQKISSRRSGAGWSLFALRIGWTGWRDHTLLWSRGNLTNFHIDKHEFLRREAMLKTNFAAHHTCGDISRTKPTSGTYASDKHEKASAWYPETSVSLLMPMIINTCEYIPHLTLCLRSSPSLVACCHGWCHSRYRACDRDLWSKGNCVKKER